MVTPQPGKAVFCVRLAFAHTRLGEALDGKSKDADAQKIRTVAAILPMAVAGTRLP